MSKQVDERVVEMEFDNSNFEKNVQTSMNTLDKLKQKLKFTDSAKELAALDKKANSLSFSGLLKNVESVQHRLSGLMVARNAVITNLVNSAMDSARKLENVVKDAIIGGGIRRAQNIENAHFMLQGLLKDEEKVQEVMANAMDSVDGTAYAYDEAAKAASQFAASGIEAGDQMMQALRGITGVAAMTNSSYEDISRVFTTVAGNGRLMGDQLLQLSSRGMNAAATLAKHFGKTEEEIRDMVSHGEISFEMFAEAMDSAFGEHAKKANETFSGAMSNVKAALSRIGAKFFSPLIVQNGTLVKMFNSLRERINDINKEVDPLANTFVNAVETVAKKIDNTINNDYLFKYTLESVKNIIEVLKQVGDVAKDAFNDIFPPKTQGDLTQAARSFSQITESMKLTEERSEKLKSAFKGIFAAFDIFGYLTKSGINFLLQTISIFTDDIFDAEASLGDMVVSFRDWLKEGDRVGKAFEKITNVIRDIKKNIDGLISGNISIEDAFSKIFSNIEKQFSNFSKSISKILPNLDINKILSGGLLISLIKNTGKIGDAFTNLTKPFVSFDKTFKSFGKSFTNTGKQISQVFEATSGEIKTKSLLNIAEAIGILAGSLWLLAKVDADKLAGATKSLMMVIGVIGGLMVAFKAFDELGGLGSKVQNIDRPVTSIDKLVNSLTGIGQSAKQLIQSEAVKNIATAISMVAGSIALLANFEPSNLMAAAGAISMVGVVMTGMMTALTLLSKNGGSISKASIASYFILPTIAILASIIRKIAELPATDVLAASSSLSLISGVFTGMFAAFAILGKDAGIIPQVASAAVAFDAMIAIVGALVLGIGTLFEKFDGLDSKMDKGIEIMGKIGTAIGTLVGNLIGSLSAGALSGLPEMGNYLSQFIQNAQPFFDGINSFKPESASAIKDLVIAMGFLAAEDFLSTLTKLTGLPMLFGESSFSADGFAALGDALKAFGDATADISDEQITSIKNSAEAIKAVVEVANEIPNEGGWISKIVGDNKMGDFGPQMEAFGNSLKLFGESVTGLNVSAINNAIEPARSMIEIAEMIPNSGGLFAEIAGDNNIAMFGLNLGTFGDCIVRFSETMSNFKGNNISKAKQPMTDMVEIAQMVPMLTEGTAAGFLGGDNSLSKLGTEFILFADKLKTIGEKFTGIKFGNIKTGAPAMKTLFEAVDEIPPKKDYKHLSKFGKQLNEFAEQFNKFSKNFETDSAKVTQIKTTIANIVNAVSDISIDDTGSLKSITDFAKSISTALSKGLTKEQSNVKKSGENLVKQIVTGINNKKADVSNAFVSTISGATGRLRSYYSSFYSSGNYLVEGFANGIKNNAYKAVNEASKTGSDSANALDEAIQVNSPSKLTYKSGEFFVQGYVNALGAGKSKVEKVSSKLGSISFDAFWKSLNSTGFISSIKDITQSTIDKIASKMQYGSSVLQKFYEQFLQNGKNYKAFNKVVEESAKAITELGKKLYKESSYYEQDTQNLKEHKKELKELEKERKKLNKDYKAAQNGTLKNSKKTAKEIKKDIKSINEKIKEANAQIKQDERDIADHTKQVFNDLRNSIVDSIEGMTNPFAQSLENNVDLFGESISNEMIVAQDKKKLEEAIADRDKLLNKEKELQNEIKRMEEINTTASRENGKNLEKELEAVQKKIDDAKKSVEEIENDIEQHTMLPFGLLTQMKSQVEYVSDWQNKIEELGKRNVAKGLIDQFKEMGTDSINYVDVFMKMSEKEIQEANSLFEKTQQMSSQALIDNFSASLDKAAELSAGITELTNRGFSEAVIKQLTDMGSEAYDYVQALLTMTPEQQQQFKNKYEQYLSVPDDTADSIMASYARTAGNSMKSFTDALAEYEGNNWSDKAGKIGLEVCTALTDTYDENAKKKTKKTKKEMGKAGEEIGENLNKGTVKGVKKTIKKTSKDIAKLYGDNIPTSVQKMLGIASPSKVFAKIGEFVNLGFIKGVKKDAKDVRDATVQTISDAVSAVADSIDPNMDVQPTITPVVDLSEIQNGEKDINSMLGNLSGAVTIDNATANSIQSIRNDTDAVWGAINELKDTVKQLGNVQGETVINNQFNIENPDPNAVANEVSIILQRQIDRRSKEWA